MTIPILESDPNDKLITTMTVMPTPHFASQQQAAEEVFLVTADGNERLPEVDTTVLIIGADELPTIPEQVTSSLFLNCDC
jgi:hypothetical protein